MTDNDLSMPARAIVERIDELTEQELWRRAYDVGIDDLPALVRRLAEVSPIPDEDRARMNAEAEVLGVDPHDPRPLALLVMRVHGPNRVSVYPECLVVTDTEGHRA